MEKNDLSKLHKLGLKEVQQRALNILVAFDRYCAENNLSYMLAYGTCLGAVRHQGFIPWDDDVDVMMPRPEFNRLIQLIKEKPIKGLELLSIETNEEYTSALAKLYDTSTLAIQHYSQIDKPRFGVYIDIFIIDGLPSCGKDQVRFYNKAYRLRRLWSFSVDKYDYENRTVIRLLKQAVASVFKIVGYRFWLKLYNRHCCKYEYETSQYAGISLFSEHYSKEIHNREMFEETTEQDFCGYQLKVPKDYDGYLSKMYGNYMELPPEDQRAPKHGTSYYDFPAAKFVE